MKTALALALVFASSSAAALGLGQITLKSRLGQPLLAEIPIISSDPAELEQLRAGLPSAETFARIGLQLPDEFVASLKFTSALDAAGNPVIRVTSEQPVNDPLLTFLVEVDSGQGRVVREFSLLVDTPRTVSAPLQPAIQAAVQAPSNTIVRAPQIAPAPAPALEATTTITPEPRAVAPAPPSNTAIPAPAPAPAAVARPPLPPAPVESPREYGAVARGESLSQIAGQLDLGASLEQTMIALLRANPDAFIDDNINLLKQGAVLRIPQRAQVTSIDAARASVLVRSHMQQWRAAQRPVPQPAIADAAAADAVAGRVETAPRASAPRTTGDARLEIVPPGASRAKRAGTQSGINAGGEGEMLRQELQQTKETLAARDAELADMQSRIAELEKLHGDQQRLLSMKDSELAAAQQRLATSQQATPATPPAVEAARSSSLPWVLGGVGLLVLALLGGWLMRRRAAATPRFHAPPVTPSSLADAFAPGLVPAATGATTRNPPVSQPGSTDPVDKVEVAQTADSTGVTATTPEDGPLPFWGQHQRDTGPIARAPAPAPAPAVAPNPAPAWHGAAGKSKLATRTAVTATPPGADLAALAAASADVPGHERLELARAYLDLGDRDSARQLLSEVIVNGDHDHRQQATRMLRELE